MSGSLISVQQTRTNARPISQNEAMPVVMGQ